MQPSLFPYPTVYKGTRYDGTLRRWPEVCETCPHRNCEAATDREVHICSYGLNYKRVTEDLLIAGVVLRHYERDTQQRKKRLRELPLINKTDLEAAADAYNAATDAAEAAQKQALKEKKRDILDAEQFKLDYVKQLKREVERGLSFVHDYRQINAQIARNINVVIETRYDGDTLEEKLAAATDEERAIYEASRFLEEKLLVAKFLVEPEWLRVESECCVFQVHGMVFKYVKIYESLFDKRQINLRVLGSSYNEILANPRACGVVPHTFLDNAVKYSPRGADVEVFLQDRGGKVYLEVASFGPELEEGEARDIFRPFYRGIAAQEIQEEGAGYGLYVSQLIAREHLGTEISVRQDKEKRRGERHVWTAFSVVFPERAAIL